MHPDFISGIGLGLLIGIALIAVPDDWSSREPGGWRYLKAECEKSAPSAKECQMLFVPKAIQQAKEAK